MSQGLEIDDYEREEESLSLCDLPVSKPSEEGNADVKQTAEEEDSEFDFGSLIGSLDTLESEMCVADEVFSGGQMLPYRHSVSTSEGGISGFRIPTRSGSRSESIDRFRFGSRSSSSRSSSTRSHQSIGSSSTSSISSTTTSTSNCSNNTFIKTMSRPSKPKTRNQFHSYPSPKPQIRVSGPRSSTSTAPPGAKSTMWQVLRLGLVRTPEIELQDLKARNNNRASNLNKTLNRSASYNSGSKLSDLLFETKMRKSSQFGSNIDKSHGGFFKSCKCSVGAVEPMPVTVRIKGGCSKTEFGGENKVRQNLAMRKEEEEEGEEQEEDKKMAQKKVRQGKQVTSHHRTFEWLIRDLSLSHAAWGTHLQALLGALAEVGFKLRYVLCG